MKARSLASPETRTPDVMATLASLRWPDAETLKATILVVPLGSTEQHGPHLPLSTDTDIAIELCGRLGRARNGVTIAPALPYGASGEHADFPGTLSIGTDALATVLIELGRSASNSFDHLVFVCGHGGNAAAITRATSTLTAESRSVVSFFPRVDGDAHAGFVETSMLLAIDPGHVAPELATVGNTAPIGALADDLRRNGVRAVSPNGILGDPTAANVEAGERILELLTAQLLELIDPILEGTGQ